MKYTGSICETSTQLKMKMLYHGSNLTLYRNTRLDISNTRHGYGYNLILAGYVSPGYPGALMLGGFLAVKRVPGYQPEVPVYARDYTRVSFFKVVEYMPVR